MQGVKSCGQSNELVKIVRLTVLDRFNDEYLSLRFGYPSHFAGTTDCGIAKNQPHPLIIINALQQ